MTAAPGRGRDVEPRVARSPDEVAPGPSIVTIGVFDGVHRGHQAIIGRAVRQAEERGVRSAVITFDRHPLEVVRPGTQPRYLMSLDRRVETLLDQGVDLVLVLEFSRALSELPPDAFVATLLAGPLQAAKVIVGTNFRFGNRAAGDVVTLDELGAVHGFATEAVTLLSVRGLAISSTQVREHLAAGDVVWAREALGRPHVVEGEVVRGDGRGSRIGVPTANLAVDERMQVPGGGVYAGYAGIAGAELAAFRAVVNIGSRPTFEHGTGAVTVEAHLLDYPPRRPDGSAPDDGELYGETLSVALTHRLRDERRFDGVDELVAQIQRDIDDAGARL